MGRHEVKYGWKAEPKRVTVPYTKVANTARIQSTTGHEESGGKTGGPPPKAKYYLVTDREQYREGKVKSTPGGE